MASEIRLGKLAPARGATHKSKRVGCGPGSGHGKTSCRGHKGQGQRKGKEYDERFEGGQMPFFRRLPKRGFKNVSRQEFELVKVEQLAKFPANTDITPEILIKENFVKKGYPIKLLGDGEVCVALNVKLHAFSQSAKNKIEKAGGRVEIFKAVAPEKK